MKDAALTILVSVVVGLLLSAVSRLVNAREHLSGAAGRAALGRRPETDKDHLT